MVVASSTESLRLVAGWSCGYLSRTCFEFLNALRHLLNGRRLPLNDHSLLRNPFTQPLQLVVRAFWRMGQGVLFRHGSRVRA